LTAAAAARELRRRGWQVLEIALGGDGSPAISAVRVLFRNRAKLREVNLLQLEFGALDLTVFWAGLLLSAFSRTPTLVVAHDAPTVIRHPGAGLIRAGTRWRDVLAYRLFAAILDRPLRRALSRTVDVGVVLTEQAHLDWAAEGPRRIAVVEHGADPPSEDLLPPSAGRHVLFAGFVGPSKGVDVLLDAWEGVETASPLPLLVVGTHTGGRDDEQYVRTLRRRADALRRPPVWLGHVSDQRLARLFAEAAIVVVPYRSSNPSSAVIVRAMVEGRSIVATRVPAALDALQHGIDSLLVEPGDAAGLAEALGLLLERPALRDRLGEVAGERASDRFTWDRHLAGLEAAYALAREAQ
jgi:glycosyltransferase involved in cell wall biosynthesis